MSITNNNDSNIERKNRSRDMHKESGTTTVLTTDLTYLPVYFLCEESKKFRSKCSLKDFFRSRFQRLMKRIATQPIFLSEKTAREHSHYISGQVWLLKAYVPESAVQGQGASQQFAIKTNCLNQMRVHGGYPTWLGVKERYVENPEFEYAVYNRNFV